MMRSWPPLAAPSASTAAVIDCHDDDADRPPHHPRPHLLPTQTEPNSAHQILSPQPATDNDVDRTLAKIEQMMRSWPPIATNHDPSVITCNTPRHLSSLPPPETISVDDEPFDYGSTLDKIAAKVEQMRRRWPATTALTDP